MGEFAAGHTLRQHVKTIFPKAHMQRFEDSLSPGIPDANVCLGGAEIWLEGKHVTVYPKRTTTKVRVGIRPEQRIWIKQRDDAGGIVFVWVRTPDGWYVFDASRIDDLFYGIPLADWLKHEAQFKSCRDMLLHIACSV